MIVTCYPAQPHHIARISAVADANIVFADDQSIAEQIPHAEILCGHIKSPVDWEEVVRAGRLRWIQSTAAGLDHCLVPEVIDSPIVVSSASGVFADQVAEHALALLLGLLRGLPTFFRAGLEHRFERRPTDDLHGKVVAIVGFGGNGRRIAKVLEPFRCRLMATDCFADWRPMDGVDVYPSDQIVTAISSADVVIATLPLTAETHHWIDARCIAAMKPGAYFINVGRGATVDELALIHALQSGHVAGAGLDVVEREPLSPESPLWDMPQVIITPHVGAQSARRLDDVTELFCRNLQRWNSGLPLWNLVDKRLGFPLPANRLPDAWRTG